MTLPQDITDFTRRDIALAGKTKPVLCLGTAGPAIIVIHEAWGFTSALARFCRWIADAGLRVYAPILFGSPDAANTEKIRVGRIAGLCISREFNLFSANRSSPVTDWLRLLAQLAHQECGGPGVGAIGMCLTGSFALSMAVDPVMLAPVLAQPGMPAFTPAALDITPDDLRRVQARTQGDGLSIRGYRFEGDKISRHARFETLRTAFGPAFIGTELPDACGNPAGQRASGQAPHAVFTGDLIDAPGEPTRQAVDEIIAFFREKLSCA